MINVSKLINQNGIIFTLKDTNARNKIQYIFEIIASQYQNAMNYFPSNFVIYNDQMYRCIANTTGSFDPNKWKKVTITELLEFILNGGTDTTYTLVQSNEDARVLIFTPSRNAEPTVIRIPETVYNEATQSAAGLLSAADKSKLDGIDISADVNKIESIKVNNIEQPIVDKAVNIIVPTATSELTNDSTYQTLPEVSDSIAAAIAEIVIPSKLSDLIDDIPLGTAAKKNATDVVGLGSEDLITSGAVQNAIDEHKHIVADITDFPTSMPASDVYDWAKASTKPSYRASEIINFPTSMPSSDVYPWAKAAIKPTYRASEILDFPTSLPASDVTSSYSPTGTDPVNGTAVAAALGTLDVASVGGTGKYIQSISETDGKINAIAQILDKVAVGLGNVGNFKAVSTIAMQGLSEAEQRNARNNIGAGVSNFSGSYNDLSDVPAPPEINNGTLIIQKNGTNIGSFSANQNANSTINVTVPTVNNGTLTIKKNGSTIGSFSANQNTDSNLNIIVPTQPSDINAATDDHNHDDRYVLLENFSKIYISAPSNPTAGMMWISNS